MPTVSEQFHTIANIYNKISIAAGCAREFLKAKPLDTLTKDKLKAKQEELMLLLKKVEDDILDAGEALMGLKDFMYKKVDKDTQL